MVENAHKIMIVDDELFFRELLRDILNAEGFTVVGEAADGREALEKYKIYRPDLLIMDIFMPEKNGIDATREIVSFAPEAKVIICSGVGYDDDINAAYQAGAKDVIFKPFYPAEVIETVRKTLG